PHATRLRERGLPETVFAIDYAPYSEVFPFAEVVVHQAGVGTTAQVLRSGRPSLAVPFGADQYDNAARLERLGCGTSLPASRYNAPRASQVLKRLMANPDKFARANTVAS